MKWGLVVVGWLLAGGVWAQPGTDLRNLRVGEAAFLAAATGDVLASQGRMELNPVLGRGEFRMQAQGARSLAISAGVVVMAEVVGRKWPGMRRPLGWVMWGMAGARAGAAVKGWSGR